MRTAGPSLPVTGVLAVLVALLSAAPVGAARSSRPDRCAATETLSETAHVAVTLEATESRDIYRVCWRRTGRRRVVAAFSAEQNRDVGFRIRGDWVVWRYSAEGIDRMRTIDAHTGRRGPSVTVPTPVRPLELTTTGGPVAQDVGDASVMGVSTSRPTVTTPGLVSGVLPSSEGGGQATALYVADGYGGDTRIDVGSGVQALHHFRIRSSTLYWINHATANMRSSAELHAFAWRDCRHFAIRLGRTPNQTVPS